MDILEKLTALEDDEYASFQSGLTPGISRDRFIGVRVPEMRKLALELCGTTEAESFLTSLPHFYFDENMLHGALISRIKDMDTCIAALESFLPYVDNWAVCDTISPHVFTKHRVELLPWIYDWAASPHVYTCRFGLRMLMNHYLDDDFEPSLLEIPASIRSQEYYVNMMVSWFFATALAKQWNDAIPYLLDCRLPVWVHNKTIQKAKESRRITSEQKEYLLTLKR